MKEINLDENKLEIKRVEYKCNKCGEWNINETGLTFYHALICPKCNEDTTPTKDDNVITKHYFNRV